MNNILKSTFFFLATGFSFVSLHAQDSNNDESPNPSQSIIIHKKDSVKEKVTVVIDGNNVTVNGKPVDDFKSDDIDIIQEKNDMDNFDVFPHGGNMAIAGTPRIEAFRDDMLQKIKYNTAFLGIMSEKTDQGAKITDVTEKSAAEKAGLKEGDIITKIGDDKVTGPNDLYKAVGKHKPDDKVSVTYLRDGKQATANVTLGKSDQMKVYSWNAPNGNFNYNFNKDFNRGYSFSWDGLDKPRLGISAQDTEDGNGVKILDIDDDSPAAKAGLKEDDIITQVNGKAITSTDDLRESVKSIKKGDTLKITYKRNNQTQTVDVKFPKDLKTVDL